MPKIIVHPGFHKTGTTFVQDFLLENGPALWPVTALGLQFKMQPAIEAAKIYSLMPNPKTLEDFKQDFRSFTQSVDLGLKRSLIISAEGLSGNMPGRHGIEDFGATVSLQRAIYEVLIETFGKDREIVFYFSTRAPSAWLRSAYWQTLRATFLTDDYEIFQTQFSQGLSLIHI